MTEKLSRSPRGGYDHIAVSYTHLDVYKRQQYTFTLAQNAAKRAAMPTSKEIADEYELLMQRIEAGDADPHRNPIGMFNVYTDYEPVSYTHLDVYKRQFLTQPRKLVQWHGATLHLQAPQFASNQPPRSLGKLETNSRRCSCSEAEHTLGKGRLRRRKCLFRWGISEPCRSRGNARGYLSEKGGCGSSVVEHTLGKGEVESSILSHSTTILPFKARR